MPHAPNQTLTGSSPRVRGTLCAWQPARARLRFIPACAGNSPLASPNPALSTVHPRVCGELAHARRVGGIEGGSSPRVRGTLLRQLAEQLAQRFIPACAGNSQIDSPSWQGSDGSSPRVRGTPIQGSSGRSASRFIPACAGNSQPTATRCWCISVHPRVCGELPCPGPHRATLIGSSPRVRGTRRPT